MQHELDLICIYIVWWSSCPQRVSSGDLRELAKLEDTEVALPGLYQLSSLDSKFDEFWDGLFGFQGGIQLLGRGWVG